MDDDFTPRKTYGFITSHGYHYPRLRPKSTRHAEWAMTLRLHRDARDALIQRGADESKTKSGNPYTREGDGRGLGHLLSDLCNLWRSSGEQPDELYGIYDNRPATIRELDAFRAMQPYPEAGRQAIHISLVQHKGIGGAVPEDAYGIFRWSYTDLHILADDLMALVPIWSPYDVPRSPVLRALIPPEYADVPEEWSDAVQELFDTPRPFSKGYGLRASSPRGGLGKALIQTTINLPPADQETLGEIAHAFVIPNISTLLTALAAEWLTYDKLPGGHYAPLASQNSTKLSMAGW